MKKKVIDESGSTLVLLMIIIATIILMGTSLLNITMSQFKIRKSNSDIKRAFYISETGLNNAYLRVYDLICEAAEGSVNKADEYLITKPDDLEGSSNLFKSNYKLYITNNISSRVYDNSNPYIDIVNETGLSFINEKLIVKVNSKYLSESGIEKSTAAEIIISVPDYIETKANLTDFTTLIQFINFNL